MNEPLYTIRTDAVLIHPALFGIPIINPPKMCARTDSPNAQFAIATVVPPLDWMRVLSWYGISQPRRGHVWPLRALLHLYLLAHTHHGIRETPGPSLTRLTEDSHVRYTELLEERHPVQNFWVRFPEMLLMALIPLKEQHIKTVLAALLSVPPREVLDQMGDQYKRFLLLIQEYLVPGSINTVNATRAVYLQPLLFPRPKTLTTRRAGIIERTVMELLRTSGIADPSHPILSRNKHDMNSKQIQTLADIAGGAMQLGEFTQPPGTVLDVAFEPVPEGFDFEKEQADARAADARVKARKEREYTERTGRKPKAPAAPATPPTHTPATITVAPTPPPAVEPLPPEPDLPPRDLAMDKRDAAAMEKMAKAKAEMQAQGIEL